MALFSDDVVGIAEPMFARAYALAERGRGTTSPNPLVGCVVVRDGRIVGEGYHERAGGPHAEVVALDAAGELARGAHVYVTLEPCNHFGKTPPCTQRLIAEGVASVTYGMRDPNPDVSGGGAETLVRAGIAAHAAPDPAPFEEQNEAWLTRVRTGLPFVTVKVALTLDGRPALVPDKRSRITGTGGSSLTMRLRRRATAVAVGAATVAVDDPLLTVRDADGRVEAHTPMRFVLSRTSVPDPFARVFTDGRDSALVVSDSADSGRLADLESAGVRVHRYPYAEGLRGALSAIAAAGVNDLLVEAGPALFSALWEARLVNELVIVSAGGMGGSTAPPLFLGSADRSGEDLAAWMHPVETAIVESDGVTIWRPGE